MLPIDFGVLVWADNVIIASQRIEHLKNIFLDVTAGLQGAGFRWKDTSLEYLPGFVAQQRPACIDAAPGLRLKRVDSMTLLGVTFDASGSTEAAQAQR